MQVQLLGTSRVEVDGKNCDLSTRAEQILLAWLALEPDRPHPRSQLAGLLWPDSEESQARSNLRHALWRLKSAIGDDFLEADKETITLTTAGDLSIDVREFVDVARAIESAEALIASLEHYGGELLPGFYEDWAVRERGRITATYERRMARLLHFLLEEGRYEEMKRWAKRWIGQGGAPEPAYRALMSACAALGDQVGMAEAYERCVRELDEELGVVPSSETVELYEALAAGDRPPGAPRRPPKHNLPYPISSFIGREGELKNIDSILADPDTRLLTLTGPPGVGKTRLALEAAWRQIERYRGGVWWVELAPVDAADRVAASVARSIGLEKIPDGPEERIERLAISLDRGRLLLVIDNCEHLLDGLAPLTEQLLRRCQELTVLTTSRHDLSIPGEVAWEVPTLEIDAEAIEGGQDGGASAVELFASREVEARRGFEVTAENLSTVTEICRRLDGVALAIELASARMKALTTKDLLDQLDRRFDLLRRESTAGDPKHRTLEASLRWSLELLSNEDLKVFLQLSVFRGGFELEQVQMACSSMGMGRHEVEASVARLVEHSLVTFRKTQEGRSRYGLLETIREYGERELRRLDHLSSARLRHIQAFVELCKLADQKLEGPHDTEGFERLDIEYENIRAALASAIQMGEVSLVGALTGGIFRYLLTRRDTWQFAIEAADCVIEHPVEVEDRLLAYAYNLKGLIILDAPHIDYGEMETVTAARTCYEQALGIGGGLGDARAIVFASSRLANLLDGIGETELSREYAQQAIDVANSSGDSANVIMALLTVFDFMMDRQGGLDGLRGALIEAEKLGSSFLCYMVSVNLGWALQANGSFTESVRRIRDAIELAEQVGELRWISILWRMLAYSQALLGEYPTALRSVEESSRTARIVRGSRSTGIQAGLEAWILTLAGEVDRGLRLFRQRQDSILVSEIKLGFQCTNLIRSAWLLCKAGEFEEANSICSSAYPSLVQKPPFDRPINGWGMSVWAEVAHGLQTLDVSTERYLRCFEGFGNDRWAFFDDKLFALEGFISLLLDVGEYQAAAKLLLQMDRLRERAGMPVHPIEQERRQDNEAQIIDKLGAQWRAGGEEETDLGEIDALVADAANIARYLCV